MGAQCGPVHPQVVGCGRRGPPGEGTRPTQNPQPCRPGAPTGRSWAPTTWGCTKCGQPVAKNFNQRFDRAALPPKCGVWSQDIRRQLRQL